MSTREKTVEAITGLLFVAAAAAMALWLPFERSVDPMTVGVLGALLMAVMFIEFDVGEGRTRPILLVLVPMLFLLPAPIVPLTVGTVHLLSRLPGALSGKRGAWSPVMAVGDAWFAVGPALVFAVAGVHEPGWALVPVAVAALAANIGCDFVVSQLRLWLGLGLDPREQLKSFGWVYLVDVLLSPVGILAALAAREHLLVATLILPLGMLLNIFARERRGRLQNAMQLHDVVSRSEERLRTIVMHASDMIATVEPDGTLRSVTGNTEPYFGADGAACVDENMIDRLRPNDRSLARASLRDLAGRARGESRTLEWQMRMHDGSWRYVEVVGTNLLDEPALGGIVLTIRDVEERKAIEEQLRHRAFHDPLTNLANRALFYDRLERALSRQAGEQAPVGLIFVDLDDLKQINDALGHAAGDELLVAAAQRLAASVRTGDTVARLSGDGFGVIVEGASGHRESVVIANRILRELSEPLEVDGRSVWPRASIGIAISEPGDTSPDTLLGRADLAMYQSKHDGKNRYTLYSSELEDRRAPAVARDRADPAGDQRQGTWFQRSEEQRMEILSLLDRPDSITSVFQPIIDLRTGVLVGYEALARFNSASQRPPNAWFAQAHQAGLGEQLELHAVRRALAVPSRPPGTYLSVNLSPSVIASEDALAALPKDLSGLLIEITENQLINDDAATQALAALRSRGARIAVDDAGAGYAGLTHLMRLAPDVIKLDRALVDGVAGDPVRAALIESFVRFARRIDAVVCAEGIETLDDLRCLADLDVAYGQGYVIARPVAPWAGVSESAAEACRSSLEAVLDGQQNVSGEGGDELEHISRRLAEVSHPDELWALMPTVGAAVGADAIGVSRVGPGGASLVVHGRVLADASAQAAVVRSRRLVQQQLGNHGSMLLMPVVAAGGLLALIELRRRDGRPWSRREIRYSRILGTHLGALLDRLGVDGPLPRVAEWAA